MDGIVGFGTTLLTMLRDILPIAAILFGFQALVLRRKIKNPARVAMGMVLVLLGLTLFLEGLEMALFPIGRLMAQQLTAPEFIYDTATAAAGPVYWADYLWIYAFAAAIGFATTVAEPALMAVAIKANQVSGGTITVVIIQTIFAPRLIIPLAYDSGGVTTSTVTVPLVAALGLGLAETIPGRSAILDGFGLIAFASLFPIIAVMGYAQIGEVRAKRLKRRIERK